MRDRKLREVGLASDNAMVKAINIQLIKSFLENRTTFTPKEKVQKILIQLKLHLGVLASPEVHDTICDLLDHCLRLLLDKENDIYVELKDQSNATINHQESVNLIQHFAEKDSSSIHLD